MQEFINPALVDVPPEMNITTMLRERVIDAPRAAAFERKVDDRWVRVTTTEFEDQVRALAKGFVAAGVELGQCVGIMSATRYEWPLIDFALWYAGAVTVPVYETSSADQVEWILSDSGSTAVFVEKPHHKDIVTKVKKKVTAIDTIWEIENGDVAELVCLGKDIPDEEIERRRAVATGESLATIIYTSGTTGRPKGAELTHGNFVSLSKNAEARLPEVLSSKPECRTMLFIPLAHVFARFIQVVAIPAGIVVGHSPDIKNLLPDLASFHPTFLLAVPRVFEKVYNSTEQKAASQSKAMLKIFRLAAAISVAYSRAQDKGHVSAWLKARHVVFDRLVYKKLRTALGNRVEWAISGGAPLGTRLGHFFKGVGIVVLEGYGLTETTAPTAVNLPANVKIGTVGPPLPGTGAAIADDGEILLNGSHIFSRYHNNEEATAEALHDGWYHTGDIGHMDEDGYLTITGRKKEIIVTAGGKNVAPAVLEDRLRGHPLISQCLVVGDKRPFVSAIITLDQEMLPTWLVNHGKPVMSVTEAAQDPDVLFSLNRAVVRANRAVSRAESIRKFIVLDTDFTIDTGHLTPSLKLRRAQVLTELATLIDELYTGDSSGKVIGTDVHERF